ncbi:hypothetical protein Y5S_02588 [Alcanivorax nanhaiticus]|uniref:Phage abortive infection protein n=1 Tax=Alcanivorax nanhaiticus TaxID=1177154 RepID=A0A095TNR8_9GAMM|nr:hypothetical protein [Alcanivorax nanhaiticus]KGD64048.1 hypothetical protein Y5S_02588 [Alcanivorax nanhaiticus]
METTEAVTEGTEDQNNNSEINATNYYGYMIAGVVILLLVIAAYFINFNFIMNSKPGGSAEWGAFGDFVGGIANPFLGFVTILLLISSLRLQVKELRESTQAVRQSAMELGLTRKFHANQETLQLRDNVRPQIDSEYKNRIAACEYLLNDDVYRGRSLKACIDKSPPSLFDRYAKSSDLDEQEQDYLEEQYKEKLNGYICHIDDLISCALTLIKLSDSDVFIAPVVSEVDDKIIFLVWNDVISFKEADERWYSQIEKEISKRLDNSFFPSLETTNINLMEIIENRRMNDAEFAEWADPEETF